ncbi:MAG TPA: prolyl oligopeptidase family serine peptidase [Candidatus Sulfopaludibacter sp.]|jgi:dipeptidyl aminopeptidase/acylaminoacyl peptidase|nr:prolyl oligopeptidase family serine peptidase [Candidatus Sulfopaludibacter sp.]
MKPATRVFSLLLCTVALAFGAEKYQKPPKAVLDVVNAPTVPQLALSPTHTFGLEASPVRYPPIAELSQPMLRIAGMRINPKTNGLHNTVFNSSLSLRKVPEGVATKVDLPPNGKFSAGHWSADGLHFAFTNTTSAGIELWIGDTTGKTHKVEGARLNGVLAGGGGGRGGAPVSNDVQWLPDNKTLLVELTKPNRGPAPAESAAPTGPHIQESLGGGAPEVTHEDMLQSPHDEDLFAYYATSQLATVDSATGKITPFGKAAIIASVRVSPNGKDLLVTTIHKPFSYLHSANDFPKDIEVWDLTGKLLHKVASLPLADKVPINGVLTGPRSVQWRASDPATLLWAEALDGGDLKNQVPFRDKIMALKAPFTSEPHEIFKTEQRFTGLLTAAKGGMALVSDSERKTRRVRTFQIDLDKPGDSKLIWSRNQQDRYKDPGTPIMTSLPNGSQAILQDGDNIYLTGLGSSPTGDHPFLDRYNLTTKQSDRLFQCDNESYEAVVTLLDDHAGRFLTRRESPTHPPNYYVRRPNGSPVAVTHYADPQPSIRSIHKELVKYKRNDGVELSFTLYLPPDYKQGTRLPTLVWAYPYEFNDAATASQVSGSTMRFTEMTGYSQLFFVLDGYAVLDNAAMPVVGDPDVVNDHYLDQIIVDSKAAIDKAVEMGVTDRNRVGVGGHSYGAFMTENLLAHCDLFKAGIAESGAANRTLTPFGFQSERRTIWEAPDVYLKMSPFMYADKIKAPLLLIHGEADDNDGTWPIQSQRMYEAVRGNGGTVRLVFLPFEAHGYRGKETIEHILWEKFQWFDKYVKGPTDTTANR